MRELKLKHLYRHFKGKLYYVEDVAINSEDSKEYVVYRQMYDSRQLFVRDKEMFLSEVDHEKYPDVKQKYRFEEVKDEEN